LTKGWGILTRRDLAAAMALLRRPADGDCNLEEGHLGLLLTAFRVLWAGYHGELVIEEKCRWGEEGYRSEAVKRFRRRVLVSRCQG